MLEACEQLLYQPSVPPPPAAFERWSVGSVGNEIARLYVDVERTLRQRLAGR
jgi:hypothetical protein